MGIDITNWLNEHHREWYYLYSDTGEYLRRTCKPPEDATHLQHVEEQYNQAGIYYRIRVVSGFPDFKMMSYMMPGYTDWRVFHLSMMKEEIERIEANCFKIARVEGPFEK